MSEPAKPACCYQITLESCLDACWTDWFAGLEITSRSPQQDVTILTGLVADQAALRGLLNQIWDLNLTLIAVERLDHAVDSIQ